MTPTVTPGHHARKVREAALPPEEQEARRQQRLANCRRRYRLNAEQCRAEKLAYYYAHRDERKAYQREYNRRKQAQGVTS